MSAGARGPGAPRMYSCRMETEQERPSLVMRLLAAIVLVVAAVVVLRLLFGFLAGIFWLILLVGGIVAVVWAWRTLSR